MGKRGPQPKHIIDVTWRSELAYAIGLIATDGSLSKDGLCVDLTSKDREQLENFSKCLGKDFYIGKKKSSLGKTSFRIQFKNKLFYEFLISIGLTPKKSLTLGSLQIPHVYFFDFLRGCFDGDGTFYSYWDKRWRSSHMFYLEFTSASLPHIKWLRKLLADRLAISGHINSSVIRSTIQLKYAKREALAIIRKMYYSPNVICLSRKRLKIQKALDIEKRY